MVKRKKWVFSKYMLKTHLARNIDIWKVVKLEGVSVRVVVPMGIKEEIHSNFLINKLYFSEFPVYKINKIYIVEE